MFIAACSIEGAILGLDAAVYDTRESESLEFSTFRDYSTVHPPLSAWSIHALELDESPDEDGGDLGRAGALALI